MYQRIIDIWPNLVRQVRGNADEEEQQQLNNEEGEGSDEGLLDMDEDTIMNEYKNMYWTKLIRVEGYLEGMDHKHPLGPDILDECRAVANLEVVDPGSWAPLFEPSDFNDMH